VTLGLLELAAIDDTDLVIVSVKSHTETDHFRLGTVVDTLIRKTTTPVLLIPPDVTAGSPLFTVRHILLSLDGSALAEEALAPLVGLLRQTHGCAGGPLEVTLLRVAENHRRVPECRNYLEAVRAVLQEMPECARVQVRAEALVGSAPGAIVGAVNKHRAWDTDDAGDDIGPEGTVDLLIMATHGRGGIGRLVLGSVADYVLPRVQVPVLLVHPAYLSM
jgi:nucleotide-binding universal stress UspA family protein